jgi:hypothetical protein
VPEQNEGRGWVRFVEYARDEGCPGRPDVVEGLLSEQLLPPGKLNGQDAARAVERNWWPGAVERRSAAGEGKTNEGERLVRHVPGVVVERPERSARTVGYQPWV